MRDAGLRGIKRRPVGWVIRSGVGWRAVSFSVSTGSLRPSHSTRPSLALNHHPRSGLGTEGRGDEAGV